ncbi:MAG: aminoglycoside adenylyltransferase domain-containing protein [Oligoflexales bacterium]
MTMQRHNDRETDKQISQCLELLLTILGEDLQGLYLYGSALVGGYQAFSDIDLFAVSSRETTKEEKEQIARGILKISGVYQKTPKRPIELLIVNKSDVNPWIFPPRFDFQYGDWLRHEFENGDFEPWPKKEMPDLALLITQVLLASKVLVGSAPENLLCEVPYDDVLRATSDALEGLMADLVNDTRNALLAYSRIWAMLETDAIYSKSAASQWAIGNLSTELGLVLAEARDIHLGGKSESWRDIMKSVELCAVYMEEKIIRLLEARRCEENSSRKLVLHIPRQDVLPN